MGKSEKVLLTNMCLLYHEDKILCQMRHKDDWPGLTLPGGHVKKGEDLISAIKREVYEETGLEVIKPILCGMEEFKTKKYDRYFIFFYKSDKFKGELKASDEGEVFWLPRKDIAKYPLSLDFDLIMQVIDDPTISELLYYRKGKKWNKILL